MSKTQKAYQQARTACTFCAGFSTAAAIIAVLQSDLTGFIAAAGIAAIILITKKFMLN